MFFVLLVVQKTFRSGLNVKSFETSVPLSVQFTKSLDILFNEDGQLKRKGNSSKKINIISKVALGLIENEKTVIISKQLKRLRAVLNDEYRGIMKV